MLFAIGLSPLVDEIQTVVEPQPLLPECQSPLPNRGQGAEVQRGDEPGDAHDRGAPLGMEASQPDDEMGWPPPLRRTAPTEEELARLLLHAWFLDDGTFSGSLESLAKAVGHLKKRAPEFGMQLNTVKSVLWHPDPVHAQSVVLPPELEDLTLSREVGLTLLGGSVGKDVFIHQEASKRFGKINEVLGRLEILCDPQVAYQFLRYCTGAPKASYIMRTTEPLVVADLYQQFDQNQCSALGLILGASLTTESPSWNQATLPVDLGGLGIRSVATHSNAAFVTSCLQTEPLVAKLLGPLSCRRDYRPAVSVLRNVCSGNTIKPLPQNLEGATQRMVSECLDVTRLIELETHATSPRRLAVVRSAGLPHAGDFLNAVPCPALGLRMEGRAFSLACKYRLGLPVYQADGPCGACGKPSDKMGDHAIAACAIGGERNRRHDLLRDRIFDTAAAAVLAPQKEASGLCEDHPDRRPGDILLHGWELSHGKPTTAFDVTVVSPLCSVNATVADPLDALTKAHDRKHAKYNPLANPPTLSPDVHLVPLPVTTFGAWSDDASTHLRKFAAFQATNKGLDHASTVRFFFQRLAITLQRMNAQMLITRCRDSHSSPPALDGES